MKKILISFFIFFNLILKAQENFEPIEFINYSALWQHTVVDSSRLDDTIYNGTKHLSNWGYKLLIGDTVGIFMFIDQSEVLQGAYIEKMNLKTGNKIWSNVFNIENSGEREFPSYFYLNVNGNIEILCFRNIQTFVHGIWVQAQISIREYDFKTGQLINHIYKQTELSSDEKLVFFPGKTFLFHGRTSGYYYCTSGYSDNSNFKYDIKEFDNDADLIKEDSIIRNKSFQYFTSQGWAMYNRDTLIQARHMFNNSHLDTIFQGDLDSSVYLVDIYSSDFKIIDSLYLTDFIPYNWHIIYGLDINAGLIAIYSKDSLSLDHSYDAISFFNFEGNPVESFDFKQTKPADLYVKKLPNEEGFLFVNRIVDDNIDNDRIIQIKKSDGNGNIELIKTISFKGGRYFGINSLDLLKNNTIIIGLTLWVPDPIKDGASISKTLYIVAIDGNELGLKSNNIDLLQIPHLSISPNPTSSYFTITCEEDGNKKLEIFDQLGRVVMEENIFNCGENQVDISGLNSGMYFVRLLDADNDVLGVGKVFKK